jgi:hypothetical protein
MFRRPDLYEEPRRLVKAAAKSSTNPVQLSDEQMLLVSSLLYGYSLQDGTWGKPGIQTPYVRRLMADALPITQVLSPLTELRTSCGTSKSPL